MIARPFFCRKPRLNSNSIIPALVASVPSPSVALRIFFSSLSCTKRAIPVIAESSVASVKGLGGWVCLATISPFSQSNSSPLATIGKALPSFSASCSLLPNKVRQPACAKNRALAINFPFSISSSITHLRYTASGINCIRYCRAIK